MITTNIHRCSGIKIARHAPANANALTLCIERTDYLDRPSDENLNITLFNLPEHVTDALIEALSPARADDDNFPTIETLAHQEAA